MGLLSIISLGFEEFIRFLVIILVFVPKFNKTLRSSVAAKMNLHQFSPFYFIYFLNKFILFLAVLGLRCCVRAFL